MAASILFFFPYSRCEKIPDSISQWKITHISDMNKKVVLGFPVTFSSWPFFGITFGTSIFAWIQRMCSPLLPEYHQDLPLADRIEFLGFPNGSHAQRRPDSHQEFLLRLTKLSSYRLQDDDFNKANQQGELPSWELTYCWWTKSCTTKDDDCPII